MFVSQCCNGRLSTTGNCLELFYKTIFFSRHGTEPAGHHEGQNVGINNWYTRARCNSSETSASVSLGAPNTKKQMKARGRVLLLFRGVWNPDETRSKSFLVELLKRVADYYCLLYLFRFAG